MTARTLAAGLALAIILTCACRRRGGRAGKSGSASPVEIVDRVLTPGGNGDATEVEPNNVNAVATLLPLAARMRASIDPVADVDKFRIDIAEAGMLSVLVTPRGDAEMALVIENASGAVVAKSDRSGPGSKQGVPNLAVAPGRYLVTVRAAPRAAKRSAKAQAVASAAMTYDVAAQLIAATASSEREPNDDRDTASALILNVPVTGFVGWTGDADTWNLSVEALSAKNAVDLTVSGIEGVAFEVAIDDGLGQPLLVRKAPRNSPLVIRGLAPAMSANPTAYYVTIRGTGSNPDMPYQLRATAHLLETDAEVEPNDTPDNPFVIPGDREIVHATWTPGDVDCFALPAQVADQTIRIVVDPKDEFDPAVELLVDNKSVATGNRGGPGMQEQLSATVAANHSAVVRVKSANGNATGDSRYDVSITSSAAGY